jgi:Iron-dependent Transcriptional regulator
VSLLRLSERVKRAKMQFRYDFIDQVMLSQKSKYALKALLVLSQEYGKGIVLISEISAREKIPHRFLDLILLELKNHGCC